MTQQELATEALAHAREGAAMTNYPVIFREFMGRGIPESEIHPRENVLTFHAWRALGRHVRRGEHGVRVVTFIPIEEKKDVTGKVIRSAGRKPHGAVVFHVSQTDAD